MKFKLVLHFIILSLLMLLSVILNSYTVVRLSSKISERKAYLRTLKWKRDEILYKRYEMWPNLLRDVIERVDTF